MKKLIAIAFSLALILGGIVFFGIRQRDKEDVAKEEPLSQSSTALADDNVSKEAPSACEYTIREYNGNIAVFANESPKPFRVISVMVDDLPIGDKELLQKGINVKNQEELNAVLEDYCS